MTSERKIEQREIEGETVDFDVQNGGAVLHHKDPVRVEAAQKAARTVKKRKASRANKEAGAENSDADTNA